MKEDNQVILVNFALKRLLKLIILINFQNLLSYLTTTLFVFSYETSIITLTMKEKGTHSFINDTFNLTPFEVKVNGETNRSCQKSCYFDKELSNITIKFDNQIDSLENLFNGMSNILEIDLSNLDTSLVINMSSMFSQCYNLKKIIFGKINTSKVENMQELFHNCSKLTSIDLSNFDTSSVTNMYSMFRHCESLITIDISKFNTQRVENMCDLFAFCYKLRSINVSNFNTSKVKTFQGMFCYCSELKSLDLSNFDTSSTTTIQGMFDFDQSLIFIKLNSFKINSTTNTNYTCDHTSPNLVICIEDNVTQNLLQFGNNNCSDICFKSNIKIDLKLNKCVEYCNESDFKYEYNGSCYENCPNGTYPQTIDNYLKCFAECPYYFYIEKNTGIKYCTDNTTCPEDYNKLINETEECVNHCDEYEFHKYEFENMCYNECPEGLIKVDDYYSIINKYICKPSCTKKKPYINLVNQECVENCLFNDFISNQCILDYKDDNNKEENIKFNDYILHNFETYLTSEEYNTSKLENNQDDIYEYEKMTITMTTTQNQRNNTYKNITTIDLGECENILKTKYNIPENDILYVKKIDIIQEGMKIPKVEYDVYYKFPNNNSLEKLDLSLCKDTKISLLMPVEISESLDILNSSSKYYNDICYIASSDDGTDIILKDRQNEFVEGNKTVCQDDCDFSEYDEINQKAKCTCDAKGASLSFADMNINKTKLAQNFIDIKNILNINIMSCIKVLFSKKGIRKNIAFYLILINFIFHLITVIVFYGKQKMKLNKKIKNIIFSIGNLELFKDDIIKNNTKKSKKKKKDKNKSSKNNVLRNTDNQEEKKIKEIKLSSYKDKNKHNPVKKQNRINPQNNQNNNAFYFINTNIDKNQGKNKKKKIIKKSIKIMKYNEEELNNLPYHLALKRDQRTYCQYYISLLKTKHDLFFSFFNNRDYNSKIIKIDIFFISFTICYTVNALFFDDSTMHKIYVDQGSFNFLYQLPQIIYSSLISIVLNKPLKLLGLSEEDILMVKK